MPLGRTVVNNDSTAVIFDATDLFSGNNKEIIDLRGMSIIDGMSTVYDNSCISKRCMLDGVDAFNNSITVSSEMGIRLTIAFILGISSEKPEISAKITTMLTMLSDDKMKTRESDGRLGTAYIKYQHFGENGSQIGYHAARFRLEPKNDQVLKNGGMSEPIKPITIYVDTLFSDSWYNAIREGILRWEKSFEGAGFKNALVVKRIPADTAFHIYDPYISSIRFTGNTGTSISMRRIADPRTGEMMSFSMNIPRDYVSSIRKESTYTIADVDKRFSSYYIPDDAICEVLSSQIMQKMALAFGLANNLAGSSHYSIAQLRDPQFTQANGLTTSVTDNVLFNYVAQPGDKEKGVVIISQKPGIYDEFAIKWLYSPVADDEKIAKQWLQEKAIDERFFFGKKNKISYAYDPRCLSGDLSNDIFAATDNGISHLKYVIAESPKWLKDEKIPESYIELFPDFVFLKVYSYLTNMFSYIGGIYQNEPNNALTAPSYQTVPRELQRKAMMKILDICKDFSWMDTNKEFLHLGGPNANMSNLAYNSMPMIYLMNRISRMALSVEKSDNAYTQEDALNDLTNYIFEDVRKGKPMSHAKKIYASQYVITLLNGSNTLMSAYKKEKGSDKSIAGTPDELTKSITQGIERLAQLQKVFGTSNLMNPDLTPNPCRPIGSNSEFDVIYKELYQLQSGVEPTNEIYYYFPKDTEPIYYNELLKVQKLLRQAMNHCTDTIEKGTYQYYINIIDLSINSK